MTSNLTPLSLATETILTPNTRHYQFDTTLGRYMTAGATLKIGISQREAGRVSKNAV